MTKRDSVSKRQIPEGRSVHLLAITSDKKDISAEDVSHIELIEKIQSIVHPNRMLTGGPVVE